MLPSGPGRPKKDELDSTCAAFFLFRSDKLQSVDNSDGWLEDNEDNVVSVLIISGLLLIIVFNIPNKLEFYC